MWKFLYRHSCAKQVGRKASNYSTGPRQRGGAGVADRRPALDGGFPMIANVRAGGYHFSMLLFPRELLHASWRVACGQTGWNIYFRDRTKLEQQHAHTLVGCLGPCRSVREAGRVEKEG